MAFQFDFLAVAILSLTIVLLFLKLDGCKVTTLEALDDISSHRSAEDVNPDCSPVDDQILWVRLNLNARPMVAWRPPLGLRPGEERTLRRRSHGSSRGSKRRRRHSKKGRKVLLPSLSSTKTLSIFRNSSNPNPKNDSRTEISKEEAIGFRRKSRSGKRRKKSVEQLERRESVYDYLASPIPTTAWQCRLTPVWQRMPTGTFPRYLQTGRCQQTRCMEEFYECTARCYSVRILRRIPDACFPLPVHGRRSLFEEAWTFTNYNVVVGCECARKRPVGTYYSNHSPDGSTGS